MTSTFSNHSHTMRIMNDVREFYRESPTGIYILPEEDNICSVHALIIGPKDTPYENGFFYFLLKFPDNYPLKPPKVQMRTTSHQTVRFSPNLYASGRVCLSILGTYSGPSWSPVQTIRSTLVSIQSLLDENPYHNEPGFEKTKKKIRQDDVKDDVNAYNQMITHETLRVAVVEMLQENSTDAFEMPAALKSIMYAHFRTNYQFYEQLIQLNQKLNGEPIRDPFNDPQRPATFQYEQLLKKIVELKEKLSLTEVEDTSIPTYKQVTEKVLGLSYKEVEQKPDDESTHPTEDFNDYTEDAEEADGSNLYESESDSDN